MKILVYCPGDAELGRRAKSVLESEERAVTISSFGTLNPQATHLLLESIKAHDVFVTTAGHASTQSYKSACALVRACRMASVIAGIVMLTDDDPDWEAQLLATGTDYCVGEPTFQLANVANLFRAAVVRVASTDKRCSPSEHEVRVGGLVLNTNVFAISDALGIEVRLTHTEVRMLAHMMCHPEVVFSRDQLASTVWKNQHYVDQRRVDSQIKRIRKKLRELANDDGAASCIEVIYGGGYRLLSTVVTKFFPVEAAVSKLVAVR